MHKHTYIRTMCSRFEHKSHTYIHTYIHMKNSKNFDGLYARVLKTKAAEKACKWVCPHAFVYLYVSSMYLCVFVCIIHIFMCIWVFMCIQVSLFVCIHVFMCIIHVFRCICVYHSYIYVYSCIYVYTSESVRMHSCIYVYLYACTEDQCRGEGLQVSQYLNVWIYLYTCARIRDYICKQDCRHAKVYYLVYY